MIRWLKRLLGLTKVSEVPDLNRLPSDLRISSIPDMHRHVTAIMTQGRDDQIMILIEVLDALYKGQKIRVEVTRAKKG